MPGGIAQRCGCLASTVQMRDQAPAASPDHGVACAERSDPHGAGPVGCGGGSVVLDCCPPLLPVSMDIGGMDLSAIRAPAVSAGAGVFPLEREQLFGGGGGDLLGLICPELGVAPLVDPGTDVEDELPTPAASPVPAVHGVEPLSTQADVDVELCRVFQDVGTLPEMVTPVGDPEGWPVLTPARYPVPAIPEPSVVMAETLVVTSPAGPTGGVQRFRGHRLGRWVGRRRLRRPRWCPHRWGSRCPGQLPWISVCLGLVRCLGGGSAVRPLPPVALTPRPTGSSPHVGESDADGGGGGRSGLPDLSPDGPFDVHQDLPHSGVSPRILDGMQECQFRMTSYNEEHSGPDFTPAYGVQLHDPRLLKYVGAPESARLLSRSPEYWLHHLGREKTLSAALQLQHDILPYYQPMSVEKVHFYI